MNGMRFFVLIGVVSFMHCQAVAQCGSYPTDTLWNHDDGTAKHCFVVADIFFEYDKAELVNYSSTVIQVGYRDSSFIAIMHVRLKNLAELIIADSVVYEISYHTDGRGSAHYSTRLDHNRAKAIVQYLHEKHGVPLAKMVFKGYGKTQPRQLENGTLLDVKYINNLVSKEEQEISHQLNRRLQVRRLLS